MKESRILEKVVADIVGAECIVGAGIVEKECGPRPAA